MSKLQPPLISLMLIVPDAQSASYTVSEDAYYEWVEDPEAPFCGCEP